MNSYGYEPAWNSYFDFYISPKYVSPALLKLEDMSFHLYLRKNLNDRDPIWKMPTIRQMRRKLGLGYGRIYAILTRLEKAQLLFKESGMRKGESNVRNSYILSDPIQDLAEFLVVAAAGIFPHSLRPEWSKSAEEEPCYRISNMVLPNQKHTHVTELVTDQQTLKSETGGDGIWESVLRQLQISTPQGTFGAFLQGTALSVLEEGKATVTTNRPHACKWLQTQMAPRIKKVLTAELAARGEKTTVTEVRFVVKSE